ncbi:MAG: hypothetical protein HY751_11060 [Nitrospinae bacterium]|nr:hypothetical protein [Nitrospinota bacterium]
MGSLITSITRPDDSQDNPDRGQTGTRPAPTINITEYAGDTSAVDAAQVVADATTDAAQAQADLDTQLAQLQIDSNMSIAMAQLSFSIASMLSQMSYNLVSKLKRKWIILVVLDL